MALGISIIICTYNGVNRLGPVLAAIEFQTFELCGELIIVDNGSTDNTFEFVTNKLKDSRWDWKLIRESQPGLLNARMAGIRTASFDYLLFCDDDNVLFSNYIEIGYNLLQENSRIGALGGEGIPKFFSSKPDWFDKFSSSYAVGPQGIKKGEVSEKRGFVYGAGCFFRKAPILEIFNSNFQPFFTGRKQGQLMAGDDVELCFLLRLIGYEIWFNPELNFYHNLPEKRLNWKYYLSMKEGISLGAAVHFAYEHYFKCRNSSKVRFIISYFNKLIFFHLLLLKNLVKFGVNPGEEEKQLALVILKAKAKSYRLNINFAYHHFSQLKKVFELNDFHRNPYF